MCHKIVTWPDKSHKIVTWPDKSIDHVPKSSEDGDVAKLESISATFYARLIHTKVFFAAFL